MDHACLSVRAGFDLPAPFGHGPNSATPWSWGQPCRTAAPNTPTLCPPAYLGLPHSAATLGRGVGAMSEDGLSKAERYREAANRYGELAKQAEPGYLAEVYRKIAAQYLAQAAHLLKWVERPEAKP